MSSIELHDRPPGDVVAEHAAAVDPHGDRAYTDGQLGAHHGDTVDVHGIDDTTLLETTAGAAAKVDAHAADDSHHDMRSARVATGTINPNTTSVITIVWGVAYGDTNYTPVTDVLDANGRLTRRQIRSVTATGITVGVANIDPLQTSSGTLLANARHD